MAGNMRYLWALLAITFKSAASQRGAMMLRGVFSVLMHAIYFPVWFVIFRYTPNIGGWGIQQACLAYGIAIACWGIVSLTVYGLRTLPQQIDHGELDSYLTLPKPILMSAALSTSRSSGLGELTFGVGLILYAGIQYHIDLTWIPVVLVTGSVVFASGILFFASFGFWVRQFFASAEEIYFNFSLMASRPAPIFTGLFKILSLTVIPVGIVTHIPVAFIMTHQVHLLLLTIVATAAYAIFAGAFFYMGLRHYESGNRFGVRG